MSDHHSQALTEHAVAKQLGLSVATLRAWRMKGKGPRFVKASVVEPSRHVGDANL